MIMIVHDHKSIKIICKTGNRFTQNPDKLFFLRCFLKNAGAVYSSVINMVNRCFVILSRHCWHTMLDERKSVLFIIGVQFICNNVMCRELGRNEFA